MALENIFDDSPPEGRELAQALKELQGLTQTLVVGAAADTNIAVAGIGVDDTIVSVLHNTAGVLVDVTAEASITSAGNIQLADTDTTGDQLIVLWFNKGALL